MIKIFLPYIYKNEEFYNNLIKKTKSHQFFKDIDFYIYGNFPWSYWHGGKSININTKDVILEKNVNTFLNNFQLPFVFDLSNLNLIENDLKDRKLNMILSIMNNGANKIICSDFNLINIIKEKYPYYNLIFSDNACSQTPFTSEMINIIISEGPFESIILNPDLLDDNFNYTEIIDKKKIIIKIGRACEKCSNYLNCLANEQYLQYNFSENSYFTQCNKYKKFSDIAKSLKNEINYYHSLGFTNFILDELVPNTDNFKNFNLLLLYALNKKENNTVERILFND